MKRHLRSLVCTCLLAGNVFAAAKPNILWIITDDQRLDSIEAFNRMTRGKANNALGKVLSPNVDRLAAMGTTFINTFNNNPSCAPSRTIMHTGRYSHHTGVYGFEYYNAAGMEHWRPMVPEILRDKAGYQTVTVGKQGIRAQHFARKPGEEGPRLYQLDLGYRNEFAAEGRVDWHAQAVWRNGENLGKRETFHFPDGTVLTWPLTPDESVNDSAEIVRRLDLFRDYRPGGHAAREETGGPRGEIIGGVNPQNPDDTRDANFAAAMLEYLNHAGTRYTDLLKRSQTGPNPDQPLFIHCGFEFPHTPVLPPREFREKFRGIRYDVPEFTRDERAGFSSPIAKLYKMAGSDHYTDAEKQQMIADYFAYCAYGDSLVGKLADGFIHYSETHHRPWLILYVCGDNGWRLNNHGMIKKFGLFDEDLRNPIIVVSSDKARFPAGKVVTDFTEFVDMAPTFLAAAGIDIDLPKYNYLDGHDLARVAAGTAPRRDYIIAEPTWVIGPCALIRTRDYKFFMRVRSTPGNGFTAKTAGKDVRWALHADLTEIEPMLFDLRVDPAETRNVALGPRYRPVLDALRTKLQNIVLGDDRVEVGWSREPGARVHVSNFAPGSDDGRLKLPDLKPNPR